VAVKELHMEKILIVTILSITAMAFSSCHRKAAKSAQAFAACLPNEIKADYIVSYQERNVTVEEKLIELNAYCEDGKLFDGSKKEIRFYRIACFGNPPYNYDEIRQREREEIARLRQSFTVIVMKCNPMIQ
jgi:hypothetical protein